MVRSPPAMQETQVQSPGQEDPLEEGMATTPVFLPGESPRREEPGKLQSMGPQRVRHDWATTLSEIQMQLAVLWFYLLDLASLLAHGLGRDVEGEAGQPVWTASTSLTWRELYLRKACGFQKGQQRPGCPAKWSGWSQGGPGTLASSRYPGWNLFGVWINIPGVPVFHYVERDCLSSGCHRLGVA